METLKRLLIISEEGLYGREVNFGIYAYCLQHGRWEIHWEPDRHPNVAARVELVLKQWKAHAVIAQVRSNILENILNRLRIPGVNFSASRRIIFPSVYSDNHAIGRLVARHLLDNSFRHFGFCAQSGEPYALDRSEGFAQELARAGFECDCLDDKVTSGPLSLMEDWVLSRRRMDAWLRRLPKPVAIFCIYDLRAQEIVLACHRMGLRVPEDVAVVGVGNDDLACRVTTPALSSVDADPQRIGFEAAALMHRLLKGEKPPDKPILVPPRGVVVRQSSQWVPVDDPPVAAVLRHIRDNIDQPMNVKELVRVSTLSRRALDSRFEKVLGHTISQEIKRLRLEKARNLLEQTSMSVEAVAYASGFNDPRILCRVFRAAMGLLPSQYRGNLHKKGPV